jgi:predicted ATPase
LTCQTYYQALLPVALGREGRTKEGLIILDDALALAERTGECFFQAELQRLKGTLLMQEGGVERLNHAETCFREAIAVARRQDARSLELRAAVSLTRLYQKQGRQAEARAMLTECYAWFTEGFDTPDLQEAKELIDQPS